MASITKTHYGTLPDGRVVDQFVLKNDNGGIAEIINFGAIIASLKIPSSKGKLKDVVLGFDNLEGYLENEPHFGGVVGRYGNRINQGQFEIDKKKYQVTVNDPPHHLHGGKSGFDKKLWTPEIIQINNGPALQLSYFSKDGEEGYPGNLQVTVTYLFSKNNELIIRYKATTDQPTPLNLTNHSYFNLKDEGKTTVFDHQIQINSTQVVEVDNEMIPTGRFVNILNTPLDFSQQKVIGEDFNKPHAVFAKANGYDHNFILWTDEKEGFKHAATVIDRETQHKMEVWTDAPGIQFYTANWLGVPNGKNGIAYAPRHAFCLETQQFPDAPNHPNFPDAILRPSEVFESTTIYRFSVGD